MYLYKEISSNHTQYWIEKSITEILFFTTYDRARAKMIEAEIV